MIMHYIMEENIFVAIVCKLLEQQKNPNVILKTALKLMVNKILRCLKIVNIFTIITIITIRDLCRFESILVTEDNGKQNPNESYTNIYQKHVACSFGYKLV